MAKYFQITEEDLSSLEVCAPVVIDAAESRGNPLNEYERRCAVLIKQILSNVRWNYGPSNEVEILDDEERDSENPPI